MSKNGWKKLKKLLPESKSYVIQGGRPASELKEIINGIFYVVKTGCSWRSLPHDFPCWSTVYGYFNRWSKAGIWQWIHAWFLTKVRLQIGRKATPSAAIIDSQIKTTSCGGAHRGYDAGKQIKGRKRFILTDTQGLLLAVWICAV